MQEVFVIANLGESDLEFNIDADGYSWKSSNDENLDYFWIDISDESTLINFSHNDYASDQIMQLDFEFPFYNSSYTNLIINPNGWVGFGEDNTGWDNTSLPNSGAPNPAIMGFWDDLNPINSNGTGQGNVYFHSNEERAVVWFDNVQHWPTNFEGSIYDFQIVMYSTGDIFINYRSMEGLTNSGTIGIQDFSGTNGLLVNYNANFVEDQFLTYDPEIPSSPRGVESTKFDLYETTKEIANEKEKDLGVKSPLQSKDERFGILRNEHFPENILILDTETTGLDNENDDCLEVGSILFNVKSRSVLAQQSFLLPVEINNAEKINNIPAEITRLPQPLSEAIKYFESLVRVSDVIVAHNAEFDMKWFGLNKLPQIEKQWICSMDDITWPADRQLKTRPSVRDLALAYGVPVWNAHRALTDCIYLAEVFKRCSELEKLLIRALAVSYTHLTLPTKA